MADGPKQVDATKIVRVLKFEFLVLWYGLFDSLVWLMSYATFV